VRHEPGVDVVLFGTGDSAHLRSNIASILGPPLPQQDRDRLAELFGHLIGVGLDAPHLTRAALRGKPTLNRSVDDQHRDDLVRLAGVNHQRSRLGGNEGAVRLPRRVERIAAGRLRRLAAFGGAAAFEIEDVLVRQRLRNDLDQLAGRRLKIDNPGDASTLAASGR
jgi:hypothetical protein